MEKRSRDTDLTVAVVLSTLRRRSAMIVATTCSCVLLVALYCAVATPRFRSTSIVEIQRSSKDLLDLGNLITTQSAEIGDALNANLDIQTEIEILQSDTLSLKVIRDLDLESTYDFKPHWSPIGAVLGLFSPGSHPESSSNSLEDSPVRRDRATERFASLLKVKPIAGTRLVEVSFKSSDPRLAAAIVNDLTHSLVEFGLNVRNEETNVSSQGLGQQLTELQKEAERTEARVVELQRYAGIFSLGEDSEGHGQAYSATLDQLQQATTALSKATTDRIIKGALYDTVKHGDPELISGLDGASLTGASAGVQNSLALLQTLRGQQAAAAAQLAQDSSKFGPDYPKLVDERATVASLNGAVKDEVKRIGERARNDYEAALQSEGKLKAAYDERKQQAEKLNDRAVEYGIAKQEADNSRKLYEELSRRLGEARLIENLRSSNISVVSPGRAAAKPVVNPLLYLIVAAAVGVFLGACLALFVDLVDPTIRSLELLETDLGLTLFSILPTYAGGNILARVRSRLGKFGLRDSTPAVTLEARKSSFLEAMRLLRASVLSQFPPASKMTILVTSPVAQDGKSTVAANLAILLAQSGRSVLLIDTNFRGNAAPTLATSGGQVPGLTQLLADPDLSLQPNPYAAASNLQILPHGPAHPNAADLLSTDAMASRLERWKLQFDVIVLDTGAVLDVADPLVLGRFADLTLLVARYAATPWRALDRACQLLSSTNDSKIAVVLNGAERQSESYLAYFGYRGFQSRSY